MHGHRNVPTLVSTPKPADWEEPQQKQKSNKNWKIWVQMCGKCAEERKVPKSSKENFV